MVKVVDIRIAPELIKDVDNIRRIAFQKAGISLNSDLDWRIVKRSIDARQRHPIYNLRIEIADEQGFDPAVKWMDQLYGTSATKKKVIIIGAGPAGYFAALELLRLGIKPIVMDRGKDVRARRRDLRAIQQDHSVDPHSNYCFGEGGAGTYSDGKLYTRSHKRGDIEEILKIFVEHGAKEDILIDAHPHIGTNKLPQIVSSIRESIINHGGEVIFEKYVVDLVMRNHKVIGIRCEDGDELFADSVVLATGHSARDVYTLLHKLGLVIEAKPFALGVRVEHPQPLIDEAQYKRKDRGEYLPPSSYALKAQVENKGVFSFCMCPGGLIVPAATSPGEIVVNGMSPSRRDSPFANSGIVTAVDEDDLRAYKHYGPFAHMVFQAEVEQAVFNDGDGSQRAPALRLTDFVSRRLSKDLPDSSYIPGLRVAPLHDLLPDFVYRRLSEGFKAFGKKMKGYMTEEAVVVGTESRTSAPIRIPRDGKTLMHPQANALFPCGEGAGYAGGIVSAAMDGMKVARAVSDFLED